MTGIGPSTGFYTGGVVLQAPNDRPIFWHDSRVIDLANGASFDFERNAIPNRPVTWYGFDGPPGTGGSRRPTFRTNQINGLPALDYDGGDLSYLYGNSTIEVEQNVSANHFNHVDDYPIAVVAVVELDAYTNGVIIGQGSPSSGFFSTYATGMMVTSGGALRVAAIDNGVGPIAQGGTIPLGEPVVLSCQIKDGETFGRINGVTVATATATPNPYPYAWSSMGGTSGNGSAAGERNFINGRIAELRLYAEFLPPSIAAIEAEMAATWNV